MSKTSKSPVKVWREKEERYRFWGKEGKLVTFTEVMESPRGFSNKPYFVGILDMGKGIKTTAELVEVEGNKLKKGVKMVGVIRRVGEADARGVLEYGVKFKPIA